MDIGNGLDNAMHAVVGTDFAVSIKQSHKGSFARYASETSQVSDAPS